MKLWIIWLIIAGVFIYLFGIGAFTQEQVWDMDSQGNSIIGTEHLETQLHSFKLFGEEGGLPMFCALLWFISLLWLISSLLSGTSLKGPILALFILTLLAGFFSVI
jgi:hypothetical protein